MAKTHHSKGYSIYAYLGVKTGQTSKLHYINIRIVNTTKPPPIDIGIYGEDGERYKAKKSEWSVADQKITDGNTQTVLDNRNARVTDLILKIKSSIDSSSTINKAKIEADIYPLDLLSKSKNKRIKNVTIPIHQQIVNAEFQELYQHVMNSIKSLGYLSDTAQAKEYTEVILMLLFIDDNLEKYFGGDSISFEGINYTKRAFPDITDLQLFKKVVEAKKKFPELKEEAWKFSQFNADYLKNNRLFTYKVNDYVSLTKKEVKEFEATGKEKTDAALLSFKYEKDRQDTDAANIEAINSQPPLERYTKGQFDKNNIFEVIGQILFLHKNRTKLYSKNWKMAAMKLFDYRSRFQPKEHIKDLNVQWIDDFITAIMEKGYSTAHPKYFNPFKYNPDIFTNSEIGFYNDLSLHKFIKNVKQLFRHFSAEEFLPLVNVDKIKFENYHLEKVFQETEKDFYLTKPELDKLFFHKFKDSELSRIRHLFLLQFWFGGLRPKEELLEQNAVTILPDGYGGRKVVYIISKDTGLTNENPICTYSDLILKEYGYDYNKVKEGITYDKYSKQLKKIGMELFNREIIKVDQRKGKITNLKTNVNVEFTSYFARRSFEMILSKYGVNQADTSGYTGRQLGLGSIKNYRSVTYDDKIAVMGKIAPVKP